MEGIHFVTREELSKDHLVPDHLKPTIGQVFIAGLEAGYWQDIVVVVTEANVAVIPNQDSFKPSRVVFIYNDGSFTPIDYIPITDD